MYHLLRLLLYKYTLHIQLCENYHKPFTYEYDVDYSVEIHVIHHLDARWTYKLDD